MIRASFFEFNVATTAITAARAGFDTISHNVANASTIGYSRQIIEQKASFPLSMNNGKGMIGTGVNVYGIAQVRNTFLDTKYWSEMPILGEYNAKFTHLSLTEGLLNSMGTTGLTAQINDFFNKLHDLTSTSGDNVYRTNVTQLGSSMATFFKNTYQAFQSQQRSINEEVKTTVSMINSLGQQIASLNRQIATYESDGSSANDLRDARALLVDKLSQMVNVEVKEIEKNPDYAAGLYPEPEQRNKSVKEFRLQINGSDFINGSNVNTLECVERKVTEVTGGTSSTIGTATNIEDVQGLYDIVWKNTGAKMNIYSPTLTGTLKGLIDVRDGNGGNYLNEALTTTAPPAATTYNSVTGELKFTVSANSNSRIDLSPNGGILKITDNNGRTTEYAYSSYTYTKNANGDYDITITMANTNGNGIPTLDTGISNIRSGETNTYKGLPYYMSRLNTLVRTFATAFNEGTYMDGKPISGVTGHVNGYNSEGINLQTLFFTYTDANGNAITDYANDYRIMQMTAANIVINPELLSKPELLAAAVSPGGGIDDNNVILGFLDIQNDTSLFMEGTLKDFIIGMGGELGIDLNQAKKFEANYTDVTASIDNQRMSVSGVSLNEEMISLVKYNQQFQAAAKLISIIDEMYNKLINQTGA